MNKFEKGSNAEREDSLEQDFKEHCPDIPKDILDEIFSDKSRIKEGLNQLKKYPDDQVTFKHSLKTADLAYLVGKDKYQNDSEKLKLLIEAALVHDFGKLKVDPGIINFPGKIEGDDLTKLQKHVEDSFNHLKASGDLELAKLALLHHRSQVNNPYPSNERMAELLEGETITEEEKEMGKLLAMVDFFDALSAQRPYKAPKPPDLTEKFMRQDFGSNVDDEVLEMLRKNHNRLYGEVE